jgi:4'-phosphopantetheinyl transferase
MLISDNEVKVIHSQANSDNFPVPEAIAILSEDEKRKYSRFQFTDDKLRFLKARYILRTTASAYHGNCNPEDVQISFNSFGKPYFSDIPLQFSITHSGEVAAVAFSNSFPIGIDVEFKRQLSDLSQLSQRFFSDPELRFLEKFNGKNFINNFFKIWSAKESYLKALGIGVSKELKSFSVVDEDKISRVIELGDSSSTHQISEIDFGNNFAGSLCIPNDLPQPEIVVEEFRISK